MCRKITEQTLDGKDVYQLKVDRREKSTGSNSNEQVGRQSLNCI